jgi:hypothetical protein
LPEGQGNGNEINHDQTVRFLDRLARRPSARRRRSGGSFDSWAPQIGWWLNGGESKIRPLGSWSPAEEIAA